MYIQMCMCVCVCIYMYVYVYICICIDIEQICSASECKIKPAGLAVVLTL